MRGNRWEQWKNGVLSAEELRAWDEELARDPAAAAAGAVEDVISLIRQIEEAWGFSECSLELDFFLKDESLLSADMLGEENEETYRKYHAWSMALYEDGARFGRVLGDYFFGIDPRRAETYYRDAFLHTAPADEVEFESFCRFLSVAEDKNAILDRAAEGESVTLGRVWVLTKRLRVGREEGRFAGDAYLAELDRAISVAEALVAEYRRGYVPDWSDSDEERAHLELLCDRLAYFVEGGDAPRAMEEYRRITDAIGASDCTRYYHARDYFYRKLLKRLVKETPALALATSDYEGRRRVEGELREGADVTVRDGGLSLSFRVTSQSGNGATLFPHLGGELGLGGPLFVTLGRDEEGLVIEPGF